MISERYPQTSYNYTDFAAPLRRLVREPAADTPGREPFYARYRWHEPLERPLPGLSKFMVNVWAAGRADRGYSLRVKGIFPSREQSTFKVLPVINSPNNAAWVGVTSVRSLGVPFNPIWNEAEWLPGPVEPWYEAPGFTQLSDPQRADFHKFLVGMLHLSSSADRAAYQLSAVPVRMPE